MKILTGNSDACAAQSVRIQELKIIRDTPIGVCSGYLVRRVRTRQGIQKDCGIPDSPGNRAGCVLTMCHRNDARTADESQRWLDTDNTAGRGRADNGAVRLCADRQSAEIGGNSNSRTGAGSAGIPIEHVRISRLTASGAPTACRVHRPEISPFAQISFAQNDRACGSQSFSDG